MLMKRHSGNVQTVLPLQGMQETTINIFTLLQRGQKLCFC